MKRRTVFQACNAYIPLQYSARATMRTLPSIRRQNIRLIDRFHGEHILTLQKEVSFVARYVSFVANVVVEQARMRVPKFMF
jgi:hypothetical protein